MRSGSEVEKSSVRAKEIANERGIWKRGVMGSFTGKIEEKKCPSSEEREKEKKERRSLTKYKMEERREKRRHCPHQPSVEKKG